MSVMGLLIILIALIGCGAAVVLNALVGLHRQAASAWSQIDIQLRHRHELIDGLAGTEDAPKAFGQESVERVVEAHDAAMKAVSPVERTEAEQKVAQNLTGLFSIAERNPELATSQDISGLLEDLKTTESKVVFAQRYYNEVATAYNAKLAKFPTNVVASARGLRPRELFESKETVDGDDGIAQV